MSLPFIILYFFPFSPPNHHLAYFLFICQMLPEIVAIRTPGDVKQALNCSNAISVTGWLRRNFQFAAKMFKITTLDHTLNIVMIFLPDRQIYQHFTSSFFVRKSFEQLLVKCW